MYEVTGHPVVFFWDERNVDVSLYLIGLVRSRICGLCPAAPWPPTGLADRLLE